MSGSSRESLVNETDVATAVASRMRLIGGVKIISYAVEDGHSVTFLLANGQRFRMGKIEELDAGETAEPKETN